MRSAPHPVHPSIAEFPALICGTCRGVLHQAGVLACALAAAVPAAAQEPAAQTAAPTVPCDGQTITDIRINTRPAFDEQGEQWWERLAARTANALHVTTRESVVNRFLLFRIGDPCEEHRRAESERILRTQPFIASALLRTIGDGRGGVVLLVETKDEFTPIVGASASSSAPYIESVKLGEGNLFGTGTLIVGEWEEGEFRDTYAGRLTDYQFVGRPWILDLTAARRDAGESDLLLDVRHPFLTDQQRVAWRVTGGESQDLFEFFRGEEPSLDLGVVVRHVDVGGIVRIGVPGRLSLFGLSVSHERSRTELPPTFEGLVNFADLFQRFPKRENARVNALWGVRSITFREAQSFDALRATQDIRVGFQLGTVFGRSLPVLGADDDDIRVAADLYLGMGGPRTFLLLDAIGEGRRDYDTGEWDNLLGGAHLAVYHRLRQRHTLVATVDWGAGWRRSLPFQLTLSDRDGGIRAYRDSREAGGRRVVVRLEDRWQLASIRGTADFGMALFGDAGRLKAGDVPFGMDTDVKFGVGIGLLAAFPSRSQRTWRLEFALPLSSDAHAEGWQLRLTRTNAHRRSWREPRDLRRSRERSLPNSIFEWP